MLAPSAGRVGGPVGHAELLRTFRERVGGAVRAGRAPRDWARTFTLRAPFGTVVRMSLLRGRIVDVGRSPADPLVVASEGALRTLHVRAATGLKRGDWLEVDTVRRRDSTQAEPPQNQVVVVPFIAHDLTGVGSERQPARIRVPPTAACLPRARENEAPVQDAS
jgi:hypothetical protein